MKQHKCSLVFGAALLAIMPPLTARAAEIGADGSICTLADAITAANTDAAAGGCPAGFGVDTITLQADITLVADLPEISSKITVDGRGHVISGNNDAAVGAILNVGSAGILTLNDVTVTGANNTSGSGGGIRNSGGAVTLNNAVISGNRCMGSGGGIYSDGGEVTLNSSVISSNGGMFGSGGGIDSRNGEVIINDSLLAGNASRGSGGIYNYRGAVTLTRSTVSGNSARYTGGIENYEGTLAMTDSTVNGNTAGMGSSGGIYNSGVSSSAVLTNSTVSGNSSDMSNKGGAICNSGTISLIHVTVSGGLSGGGIYNGANASLSLRNSIISGNKMTYYIPNAAEIVNDAAGIITSEGMNVFGHSGETEAEAFAGFTPGSDDVNATGQGGVALAAILKPLADNGGPTKTHVLPARSPARDIDPACTANLTADQRGFKRPVGKGCDAGAVEYVPGMSMAHIYKLLMK